MPNNGQYITFKVTVFSSCLRNYNTANDLFWTGECSIWNGCWHWWISWLPHIVTAILFWLHHGLFLHSLPPCTEVIWTAAGRSNCINLYEQFIACSAPSDSGFQTYFLPYAYRCPTPNLFGVELYTICLRKNGRVKRGPEKGRSKQNRQVAKRHYVTRSHTFHTSIAAQS